MACFTHYTHNAWFERRLDLPLFQQYPINLFQEWMYFNSFLKSFRHNATQSLTGTLCHKLQKEGKEISDSKYMALWCWNIQWKATGNRQLKILMWAVFVTAC